LQTATNTREITLQDRCDSCGAAAKVVATFVHGELLFCGHHARVVGESLVNKAVALHDPEGLIS